jgi:hypothetical protein
MTDRVGSWVGAVLTVAAGLGSPLSALAMQSYPKLLTNGRGLALTQLSVRQKNGSSWVVAPPIRRGKSIG